ncbi:uncharacterized protein LOC141760229 [Sebastes fasciatus]|uniref:uncharacterized protein LOC141760229 n=1 Tax=Sebastes fasciatus TaxID=394691 RepID=UPI003D9F0F9D
MSSTDCLRLFVLLFWLMVAGDVNCENTQKGYVRHVQAAMAVHNDNREYKRWSGPPASRNPRACYNTSSVDGGKSGNIYPAQEDPTTDSKSSQIQNHYSYPVIPETQNSNVPKSHLKSGYASASVAQGRRNVVYDRKKIHQANSDSVRPRIHRARTKSTGSFPPVQVDKAPVGFEPNNRRAAIYIHSSKSSPNIPATSLKSQKIHVLPRSFNRGRTTSLQNVFKPSDKKKDSIWKGRPPGKVDTPMSSPIWSPRVYSGDGTSEAKGYAHVRHLKPGFDKTLLQAAAGGQQFLETGFPKPNQASYSHDVGVSATSERQLNLNYNSRGSSQLSSWHPPPPGRTQTPVQGKFKPFQTRPTNGAFPAHTHSDSEMGQTQTFAGTTLPPGLNSTTGVTSPVTGDWSTESASPTQTAGRDAELVPQASNSEGQSVSSAEVGSSPEQENKPFTVSPPKLQPEEKERNITGLSQVFKKID